MWNTRRLIAMLVAVTMLLSSFAAFAETAEPAAEPAPEAAEPAAQPEGETAEPAPEAATELPTDIMASVNGVDITRAAVDAIFQNLLYQFSSYGYDTTGEDIQSYVKQLALNYAVQTEVLTQKAHELGYDVFTEEELAELTKAAEESWNSYRDLYVQYYGNLPEAPTDEEKAAAYATAEQMLPSMGYSKEKLLESEKQSKTFERVEELLTKEAVVTDEQVETEFQAKVEADKTTYANDIAQYEFTTGYYGTTVYYQPAGMRGVLHILLKVPDETLAAYSDIVARFEEQMEAEASQAQSGEAPTEQVEATESAEPTATPAVPVTQADVDAAKAAVVAAVQDKIDEIYKRFEAGESFESLIAEYGEDPGMQDADTLAKGYAVHMDSILWDPAFTSGTFTMEKVGDISKPVVGQYGVHILYYLRDIPEGAIELTDAQREELRETLLTDTKNNLFNVGIEAWIAECLITYPEQ